LRKLTTRDNSDGDKEKILLIKNAGISLSNRKRLPIALKIDIELNE